MHYPGIDSILAADTTWIIATASKTFRLSPLEFYLLSRPGSLQYLTTDQNDAAEEIMALIA
eukprot:scaffold457165_cov35-Prasinocladus_malaysianus.AAC.1